MRLSAFKNTLAYGLAVLAALSVACCRLNQPASLVGTVVYDDSNSLAREDFVALRKATVFVTVGRHFRPPDALSEGFRVAAADLDTPEGRRAKAFQDLTRSQPGGFHWENDKPVFAGSVDQVLTTQIDGDGRFRFDKLPPGQHMLTVLYWSTTGDPVARRSMARKITVVKGTTTEIEVKLTRYDFDDM